MLPADGATPAGRARLLRDLRALAAVEQRNVVRIDGTGEHQATPWVAMEYVQGTDIARVIAERGALPVEVALGYAIQAADGLAAAHGAGLLHGALRPSKLLLAPDGRVIVVDFGIRGQSSTAYLSPEQIEHGVVDARSDVWSLGCVLFEMLTGEPPFGRGGSVTASAILRDEPSFPPHVPGPAAAMVYACLRKSSFARIGSARELVALMRDALDGSDPASQPGGEPHASSSQRRSARPAGRASAPPPRQRRRVRRRFLRRGRRTGRASPPCAAVSRVLPCELASHGSMTRTALLPRRAWESSRPRSFTRH
jgi:serine/threonine protein kinase